MEFTLKTKVVISLPMLYVNFSEDFFLWDNQHFFFGFRTTRTNTERFLGRLRREKFKRLSDSTVTTIEPQWKSFDFSAFGPVRYSPGRTPASRCSSWFWWVNVACVLIRSTRRVCHFKEQLIYFSLYKFRLCHFSA